MPEHSSLKILFICLHSPFESHGGAEQRTSLIFQALCKIGHVDLVCFSDDPPPAKHAGPDYEIKYWHHENAGGMPVAKIVANKLRFWTPYATHAKDPAGAKIIGELLQTKDYDHIVLRYVDAVYRCGLYHRNDLIVDVDDDPEEKFRSFFMGPDVKFKARAYYFLCYLLTRLYTRRFLKKTAHLFFSNKAQTKYSNSSYLPNIPFSKTLAQAGTIADPGSRSILFVGSMSYPPNYIGLDLFISNVWQQVLNKFPDAELRIAGRGAPAGLLEKWGSTPGINILGFVKDLQAEYNRSCMVIAPIYHGAGTSIKVLEAMATRRSCVLTPFATRGLTDVLTHKENVMVADNYGAFSKAIIELIENPELNRYIQSNAIQTIKRYFSEDEFQKRIETTINLV